MANLRLRVASAFTAVRSKAAQQIPPKNSHKQPIFDSEERFGAVRDRRERSAESRVRAFCSHLAATPFILLNCQSRGRRSDQIPAGPFYR
jgi:hypothetical protein